MLVAKNNGFPPSFSFGNGGGSGFSTEVSQEK